MSSLRSAWLILRKDLVIEWRSKETLMVALLFSLLTVIIASLALYTDPLSATRVAPGVLWITLTFSGILVFSRSWQRESEMAALQLVLRSPVSRGALYFGKTLSAFLMLLIVALFTALIVMIFFGPSVQISCSVLALLISLGALGFTATGMLFASISVRGRTHDLMLSVIVFPLVAPALLAASVATRELFAGASVSELLGWVRILAAFDIAVLTLGVLLFGWLIED